MDIRYEVSDRSKRQIVNISDQIIDRKQRIVGKWLQPVISSGKIESSTSRSSICSSRPIISILPVQQIFGRVSLSRKKKKKGTFKDKAARSSNLCNLDFSVKGKMSFVY